MLLILVNIRLKLKEIEYYKIRFIRVNLNVLLSVVETI